MNTTTIYNKLIKLESDFKSNNMLDFWKEFDQLKKDVYLDSLKNTTSPTRKKAFSKIQAISKKIAKRNTKPVLQHSSKLSTYNGVQGYYYTDSYFLTFTRDNITEIIPEIWSYPDVERLANITPIYNIDINDLDYQEITFKSKMKELNDQLVTIKLLRPDNNKPEYKVKFKSEYLKIAYELLEIDNNKNDLEFVSAGLNKPAKLTNLKTGEFILLLPVNGYEEV